MCVFSVSAQCGFGATVCTAVCLMLWDSLGAQSRAHRELGVDDLSEGCGGLVAVVSLTLGGAIGHWGRVGWGAIGDWGKVGCDWGLGRVGCDWGPGWVGCDWRLGLGRVRVGWGAIGDWVG